MRLAELHFDLPKELEASVPREMLGERRDESRLLVIDRASGQVGHFRFYQLDQLLRPGDLLVFNNSAVVPAALVGVRQDGRQVVVHLAPPRNGDLVHREAVLNCGCRLQPGDRIVFNGGSLEAIVEGRRPTIDALHRITFRARNGKVTEELLSALSKPITYEYVQGEVSLAALQNVYASVPGSSEPPSAGRHFTPELLERLRAHGVEMTQLTLHTGVSSIEIEEENVEEHTMYEEEYNLPAEAAEAINRARREGRRVIAVGTTVTRTLETCAREDGMVEARHGWTDLYITPGYRFKAIDGLITGLHEAKSTRLVLLTAFVGDKDLVLQVYNEAIERGYRWHEFGDACLVL